MTTPKIFFVGLTTLTLTALGIAQSTDVSVLNWNIRRGIGSNTPNSNQQPYLAKVVNLLKPDIWTINELGGNSGGYSGSVERTTLANWVKTNLTCFGANPQEGKDFFVYAGFQTDGFIGNAIVSRFALSDQASYADGLRGLIHANAALPNGASLGIFTEHLKATTNDAVSTSDSQQRQSEAATSARNLTAWKLGHPGQASVLTGDFNLSEDAGQDDNWSSGNIGDVLPNGQTYAPISTLKSAGYLDGISLSRNGDKDTISSGSSNPKNRFDYNLYSDNGGIQYLGGEVFNTAAYPLGSLPTGFFFGDSALASDHLPILARYRVAAPVPEPASMVSLALGALVLFRRRQVRSS